MLDTGVKYTIETSLAKYAAIPHHRNGGQIPLKTRIFNLCIILNILQFSAYKVISLIKGHLGSPKDLLAYI